jgi:sugar lactone lactonase YvrE
MCRYKDKMYIVDRKELVEISIKKQKIIATYKYPKHIVFANDVVCDSRGNIYITNSDASEGVTDILTLKNGKVVSWIASDQFQSLNGMWIDGDELLLGNSVDATLKAIDIKTKKIRTIASLGSGTVDGIRLDRQGDVLVSKWEGVLYHITKQGKVTEILNAIGKFNIADFEYNLNSQTIFVPTFLDNGIRVFKLK